MNTIKSFKTILVLLFSFVFSFPSSAQQFKEFPSSWYYGIKINDVLCGYAESKIDTVTEDGELRWKMDDYVHIKLSVLGGGVDMSITNLIYIDPENMDAISIERSLVTSAEMYSETEFFDNKILHRTKKDGEFKEIVRDKELIIENTLNYPHLEMDFFKGDLQEQSYQVFDDLRGLVTTKSYKRIGDETITLVNKKYDCVLLEELNTQLGTTTRIWFEKDTGFPLLINVAGREIYLADESVKKQISVVDLDNVLFAKVDEVIADVPAISYMKVEAVIESVGEKLNAEGLNVRGQSFEGTVTNNLVEGVFEIKKLNYEGQGAPGFPLISPPEDLKKYLEAENLIESDDPILIAEAKKITEGAKDAWEASILLSKWVANEIKGAVPGGTSAINTYNTREGECGSHSRLLTAFCRAVGIPSRLSVGCMYSPYLGGSFGQHAWTEVHMGENGWIAIDATAFEYDFIDAGHIRLGEGASFNPKSMKILDYKLDNQDIQKEKLSKQESKLLGKYFLKENGAVFEIKRSGNNLGVLIPGQPLMALEDADENGLYFPKMTRQLNFSFNEDDSGNVTRMRLQQSVSLQKTSGAEDVATDTPKKYKNLLGKYLFSQANVEFNFYYEGNKLMVFDPLTNENITLKQAKTKGRWTDLDEKNEIEFVTNADGKVTAAILYINNYLERQ